KEVPPTAAIAAAGNWSQAVALLTVAPAWYRSSMAAPVCAALMAWPWGELLHAASSHMSRGMVTSRERRVVIESSYPSVASGCSARATPRLASQVEEQRLRRLEQLDDAAGEPCAFGAVDEAVVERQAQVEHRARHDAVVGQDD